MLTTTARAVEMTFFTDVQLFRSLALPILESDTTSNTLALSALLSITQTKPGMVLGLLSGSSNNTTVLVSPGLQGIGCQLYVAPAPDEEAAASIAQQLPDLPCTTISTTSAGAALLQKYCGWQEKHCNNVMLYQPDITYCGRPAAATAGLTDEPAAAALSATAGALLAAHTGVAATTTTMAAPAAAVAAGTAAQNNLQSNSISCTASLHLRSCSADNPADVQLVLQCAGNFLAQVFHLPNAPPGPQLQDMVLPRLLQGLYYVLCDSSAAQTDAAAQTEAAAAAVCMACHVPTSSNSTRVTMLYTPAEQRGCGYAKETMRQLCSQLASSGYTHICLMADQAEPALHRLYQSLGFQVVGDIVMLERPEQQAVAANPTQESIVQV